jgi:hypothetical protein
MATWKGSLAVERIPIKVNRLPIKLPQEVRASYEADNRYKRKPERMIFWQ